MGLNTYTPEQKAAIESFMPYVEKALIKVTEAPGEFNFTGFIFKDEPENPILIHISNLGDPPEEFLVQLHYHLACLAAFLNDTGVTETTDFGTAPSGQTPEEIADKLAISLMATPLENIPDEIKELVDKYLLSRQPKKI